MWVYEKRLQFPVKITKTCPKTAQMIISQYGGPDGELSASMRYLAQRYSMPDRYRNRGAGSYGNYLCHGLPADKASDNRAG